MKKAIGYDDSLDTFGVHAIGGMWGAISTGIFFNVESNPGILGNNQALYQSIVAGQHAVVMGQVKAVVIAILMSAIGTSIILVVLKYTIGIRVSPEGEAEGLDLSQHGEEGYTEAA
jgi:Amt family ammonium transporter